MNMGRGVAALRVAIALELLLVHGPSSSLERTTAAGRLTGLLARPARIDILRTMPKTERPSPPDPDRPAQGKSVLHV